MTSEQPITALRHGHVGPWISLEFLSFRNFVVNHFIQSSWTQKMIDRPFNELSNGIFKDKI
jgi:hypothetical protein